MRLDNPIPVGVLVATLVAAAPAWSSDTTASLGNLLKNKKATHSAPLL